LPRDKEAVYNELLVLRSQRGERQAREELVRRWEEKLYYYLRRLADNEQDAWDLLQQTWLGVLKGFGSLQDPRKFAPWLYRIARNTAMSRLRKQYAESRIISEGSEEVEGSEEGLVFRFEQAQAVHAALAQLPLAQREILTLFFLEDFTIQEIVEITNLPKGTIKSRLHYAKRALKSILTSGGVVDG
jgi:RNA polymerase sigma-70 factor (ECF subfamily)